MMVCTFGAGMSLGFPDVCKTPPFAIPAPFPNMAMNAMAIPTYFTILILGQPELNIGATYAVSNGDEGGAMGGVVSNVICGPGRPMLGSTVYFVGGMPVWRMTAPTMQNMMNAPGFTTVPSQTIKTVMT
ncbi:MAG: DUF4150 domain-containing protein [Gammaproteobacteria bacterium]|nr:DUF4150 domain-containing protein [Gammaproteobacteria bacterium]MYA66199.1 DUF4150 domain-containing protein [Gammaproteobacteria bacterium]MYC60851.1 DUF4150 domain-containing protein [Gammaproteobacteria bacterium]MYE99678.1 DUF4150 domain-containing protein [Gammaproteobacteria bacterium]MYH46188.1 DUF4150 domain-containing protein [Gammaproteobacteria bacterium]